MSYISTVADYGGRVGDYHQYIKNFIIGIKKQIIWICKTFTPYGTKIFITPVDNTKPVYIDNDLYVKGNVLQLSDRNFKKNIKIIENNKSDTILNLEPVEFSYTLDVKQKIHFGIIAQDIEILFPELVKNDNNIKSVNYIEIIPLLLSIIKKHQIEIDELRNDIKYLKSKK